MPESIWMIFACFSVLFGLAIGSFLNVCIVRMPEGRSIVPRSACPTCAAPVRARDNIPVLSWLLLRARCRDCGTKISPIYPLVELLTGLTALLLWWRFVPEASVLDVGHVLAWTTYLVFASLLIVATYVDFTHRIIPDETSIYAVPVGIGLVWATDAAGYEGWLQLGWRGAVMGALFGGGLFAVIAIFASILTGLEALGFGDVKLMAMIGAFIGAIPGAFIVMLWASILGSIAGIAATVWKRRRVYLPFGPSLAASAMLFVLYGDVLLERLFPGLGAFPLLLQELLAR